MIHAIILGFGFCIGVVLFLLFASGLIAWIGAPRPAKPAKPAKPPPGPSLLDRAVDRYPRTCQVALLTVVSVWLGGIMVAAIAMK
jgi:hypothetical protein